MGKRLQAIWQIWNDWYNSPVICPSPALVAAMEELREIAEAECNPPSMTAGEYVEHYYQGNYPETRRS